MTSPFDILFEPIRIGPVIAPNRFYQVPHCNGFGHRMPQGMAAMRGMKAEGGWGVVCTEETEIHHSSDLTPYFEGRLWSDEDIPTLALMAESVHKHGSWPGSSFPIMDSTRRTCIHTCPRSRQVPWARSEARAMTRVQTRRMDKEDIRNVRKWHREAALRAKRQALILFTVMQPMA